MIQKAPVGQPKSEPALNKVLTKDNAKTEAPPFFFKVFLGGNSGAGKTQSSITLPKTEEKPLLLIDYDNRWETVRDEVEAGLVVVKSILPDEIFRQSVE